MDNFVEIEFSSNKRPLLLSEETELMSSEDVAVYEGEKKKFEKGTAFATSHRIIWMDASGKQKPIALELSKIISVQEQSGGMTGSPKIKISISSSKVEVLFGFKSSGRDQFLKILKQSLQNQTWRKKKNSSSVPSTTSTNTPQGQNTTPNTTTPDLKKETSFDTKNAGIKGIMSNVEKKIGRS